jgi:V8-like Glu-specific endopeptidase
MLGVERADAVALIETRTQQGIGTGFVVRGRDLHPSLGDENLVLTNAHVVYDKQEQRHPDALFPDEARIRLRAYRNNAVAYEIADVAWSSPFGELDATLLRPRKPLAKVKPYPIAARTPNAGTGQRVYILGHPKGGPLSISLDDNSFIGARDPLLHYRAPTDPGSSGSPVFNQEWDLIALHHAGGERMKRLRGKGRYPANEGIWIQAIIREMENRPPRTD